jgi:hypothetical protein
MPEFKVSGTIWGTVKNRCRTYKADTEAAAIEQAECEGLIVEKVERLPDRPAESSEIEGAVELGLGVSDKGGS